MPVTRQALVKKRVIERLSAFLFLKAIQKSYTFAFATAFLTMINSKFSAKVLITLLPTLMVLVVIISILSCSVPVFAPTAPPVFVGFFSIFFIYFLSYLIFGELRTKAIKVVIKDDGTITKRNFMGLAPKTIWNLADFNGFKTSVLSSKNGRYEYLYLIIDGKKVIKISEFYHSNYKQLKSTLIQLGVKNLGVEWWSFLQETKEIFY